MPSKMITIEEVKKEIRKLDPKKSPGFDDVTAKYLQISEELFATPLLSHL